MPKVKKGTAVTATATARKTRRIVGTDRKAAGKAARRPMKRKVEGSPKGARKGTTAVRSIRIRALDPVAKCGPGTSVTHLYRVDELLDGSPRWHLVFFDRHGWYCEHGRNCPAVADVRKHGKVHHLFTD